MRNISRSAVEALVRQLLKETDGKADGVADAVVSVLNQSNEAQSNEVVQPRQYFRASYPSYRRRR